MGKELIALQFENFVRVPLVGDKTKRNCDIADNFKMSTAKKIVFKEFIVQNFHND